MKRKKSKAVAAVVIVAGIVVSALAEQEKGYDSEFETHLKVASVAIDTL